MNGVLVADKPAGWTSHDVVAKVKKTLGARKVGHLGTLDPVATGVLPLVIDGATKYARFLQGTTKAYTAALRLGVETDTYDSVGKVVSEKDPGGVSAGEIKAAFASFEGRTRQVPPMYSSVKKNGVPLYKLARKGVTVEREPKEVEITSIEVTSVRVPAVEFTVECSRGTYIRTLCHDVGGALGCGAHMTSLRRTRSGAFRIDEAVSPLQPKEVLEGSVIPLHEALTRSSEGLKALELKGDEYQTLRDSAVVRLSLDSAFFASLEAGEVVRFCCGRSTLAVADVLRKGEKGIAVFKVAKAFGPVPPGAQGSARAGSAGHFNR